jgi:hypothetical protein
MSYIFPVDDVIESFSYRFVRELLAQEFLPIPDDRRRAQVDQEAQNEVERIFTTGTVAGRANPNIIQKSIVATRKAGPEMPDMSWAGLFGLISLSDTGFAEHYQSLQQSLEYLQGNLVLTKDGDYRRESFEDGAMRLLSFADQFQDIYLGKVSDPNDPDARAGGDWDAILSVYRDALRLRFGEVVDAAVLDVLNRRDDQKRLLPNRLPYARFLVTNLKTYMVRFKALVEKQWRDTQVETRLRQVGEEVRNAITWMNDTRGKAYFPPFATEPRRAQESFRGQFVEQMNLALHRRVYQTVLDVLDTLGAAEKDRDGQKSVLDIALLGLESWGRTLQDVDAVIAERDRKHAVNRKSKLSIKVRRYLTDEKFETELYQRPEHAGMPERAGMVTARVLGQVGDQKGLWWQRVNEAVALDFKLVTSWGEGAKGAEEIASTMFQGTKGLFQVVRNNVTIAERLAAAFPGAASFANRCLQIEEPFLRYNPSKNDSAPFGERYVSFNVEKAHEETARQFLQNAYGTLRNQGVNVDTAAESVVACTVVEVARGFRLAAVEPYNQCEPEYRAKLTRGRESIHLFPEEQYATELEQLIPTLGENNNPQRALVPELTVAMGSRDKLRAFTLACVYGLVTQGAFYNSDTNEETTELFLRLGGRKLPLSQSVVVRELDRAFSALSVSQQLARLYLNALQNFMLKITERPGLNLSLVQQVKGTLEHRGVSLAGIENPFTLALRDVGTAINEAALGLGPSESEQPDDAKRQIQNAGRRLEKLEAFFRDPLSTFKDPVSAPAVRDMGTMMHLILRDEMNRLKSLVSRGM